MSKNDLIRIDKAATITGLKKGTLYNMAAQNRINYYKPSKYLLFSEGELLTWMKTKKVKQ